MNQFPPRPRVSHLNRFKFWQKFAEIFASQGAPLLSNKDTGASFFASVVDTGGKLPTGVNNIGGKFATSVNNADWDLPPV